MKNNTTLTTALQIVVCLFGAFGAFLGDILPEVISGRKFIYGITQFACLLVFLLIKMIITKRSPATYKKYFKGFALALSLSFIVFSYLYYTQQRNHLRDSPFTDEKIITGELTPQALKMCKSKAFQDEIKAKGISEEENLMRSRTESDLHSIWTPNSVSKNTDLFVFYYVMLVICLSTAVFAAIELIPKNQNAGGD